MNTMETGNQDSFVSQKAKRRNKNWSDEEVMLLFSVWRDHAEALRRSKRKAEIYYQMSMKLKIIGIVRDSTDIKTKIKNLMKDYRKERRVLRTSGGLPTWRHYANIHKIVGKFPSNKNPFLRKEIDVINEEAEGDDEEDDDSSVYEEPVIPDGIADIPTDKFSPYVHRIDALPSNARAGSSQGLQTEYNTNKDSLQSSGSSRPNSHFFNILDDILGQQSQEKSFHAASHANQNVVVLELPHQGDNGPALVSEEFVVESQESDEDNVNEDVINGTSSRSSLESCTVHPISIKMEYDSDEHEGEITGVVESKDPEAVDDPEPEHSAELYSEKPMRKRKSAVRQIEDVLNRVLDNTINRFIAFEQAMDKRAREETNSFRNKLLAIERRKLEESSTQTMQNERIINLMESLVSQRQ